MNFERLIAALINCIIVASVIVIAIRNVINCAALCKLLQIFWTSLLTRDCTATKSALGDSPSDHQGYRPALAGETSASGKRPPAHKRESSQTLHVPVPFTQESDISPPKGQISSTGLRLLHVLFSNNTS